jgi:hypothetical protein
MDKPKNITITAESHKKETPPKVFHGPREVDKLIWWRFENLKMWHWQGRNSRGRCQQQGRLKHKKLVTGIFKRKKTCSIRELFMAENITSGKKYMFCCQ